MALVDRRVAGIAAIRTRIISLFVPGLDGDLAVLLSRLSLIDGGARTRHRSRAPAGLRTAIVIRGLSRSSPECSRS